MFMAIVSHSTVSSVHFDSDDEVLRLVNNFPFNSKLERSRGTNAKKSLSRCYSLHWECLAIDVNIICLCVLDSKDWKHSPKGLPLNFQGFSVTENMRIFQQKKWRRENPKISLRTIIWRSRKSTHSVLQILYFFCKSVLENILEHRKKFKGIEYASVSHALHKQYLFIQQIFIKHLCEPDKLLCPGW